MHILSALLCLVLAYHACQPAAVIPVENEGPGGEILRKVIESDLNSNEESTSVKPVNKTVCTTIPDEEAEKNPNSSEDSRSNENTEGTVPIGNESSEETNSSSEEETEEKTISKRSVESQKDTVNNVEESSNQTASKENRFSSKDDASEPEIKTSTDPSESSTLKDEASASDTPVVGGSDVMQTTLDERKTEDRTFEADGVTITESTLSPDPQSGSDASTTEENNEKTVEEISKETVNKLSDQIRKILATFREKGVVQLPGQKFFQDPMQLQDFTQSFGYYGTMSFKNMSVTGLSNFTVEQINTDVDRLQVFILLKMKRLEILGNYTLTAFLSRPKSGPFNVTLLDVESEGVAEIAQAPEGYLEATDSVMDMLTNEMKLKFENSGLDSLLDSVGGAVFESIKPQILEKVNLVIRNDVNTKLKDYSTKFIKKVSPVELAFSEGRKYAKDHGYDPYHVKDQNFIVAGIVDVEISEFVANGLSRFYRVGNLSLSMDAGIIQIGVHVATGQLTGHCKWSGETFGIVAGGKTNFTIDHLQVRAMVNQSLDLTKKPQLDALELELGLVKVTMQEKESLNMLIEAIINSFPKLLRHMLVDTVEQPLKEKIQEILDQIHIESIVDKNLPRLDSFGL